MSHCGDAGRGLITPYISPGETRPANRERLPRVHVSTSPADPRRAAPHLLPRRAPVILKMGTRQPYRSETRGSAANGTTAKSQPRASRQLRATTSFLQPGVFQKQVCLVVERVVFHGGAVRLEERVARHVHPVELVRDQALHLRADP